LRLPDMRPALHGDPALPDLSLRSHCDG
jgi:hypothetical protein